MTTRQSTEATTSLAGFTSGLEFSALPPLTVATLKDMVLDSIGVAFAATTLGAGCSEVVEVARAAGAGSSSILGYPDMATMQMAALANGALVHALNFDSGGTGHLGSLVPAPLAVAEGIGGVSGREYLTALAVGIEVTARMNRAIALAGLNANERFLEGQLVNTFGAAAAAGRVMRLSVPQMHSALGLALMQASGSMQIVIDGDPPCKAVYAAFPSQAGVLSALLARQNLGAEFDALEGRAGFFALYYQGQYARDALHEPFVTRPFRAKFKPWPTGGGADFFIRSALELRTERSLDAQDIQRIDIEVHDSNLPWLEPFEERAAPSNSGAASNSFPFWIAKALAHGECSIEDITPASLSRQDDIALARRVHYTVVDAAKARTLTVTTNSGTKHSVTLSTEPLGSLNHDEVVAKFFHACRHAEIPVIETEAERLVQRIDALEDLADMRDLLTRS
jgi:2-methylcitrate dehydratase PrpD